MWYISGQEIKMAEGDWGLTLPIVISGTTLTALDEIKLVIKTAMSGDTILEKTYTNITQNTVNFSLTESESELLPVGIYVYRLDWYQGGAFMCNIIPFSNYKVVDKA